MKYIKYVLLAALVAAVLPLTIQSKVIDTDHNLSDSFPLKTSQPGGETQVCLPCHTPHFSEKEGGVAVHYLWNHQMSAGGWDLHAGADLDSVMESGSRLCLSCHDGSVALDAFGEADSALADGTKPKTGSGGLIDVKKRVGGNGELRNHHPVGVLYPIGNGRYEQPAITDPTDPDFTLNFSVVTSSTDPRLNPTVTNPDGSTRSLNRGGNIVEGRVQCESCHFAHGSIAADTRMFLRVDNSHSALCSQCHVN